MLFFWILKVKRNGIEAEAYVSRIEEHETIDSDGMPMRTDDVYVVYRTQEGRQVEASLSNQGRRIDVGDRILIKYLPGREEYAVRVRFRG